MDARNRLLGLGPSARRPVPSGGQAPPPPEKYGARGGDGSYGDSGYGDSYGGGYDRRAPPASPYGAPQNPGAQYSRGRGAVPLRVKKLEGKNLQDEYIFSNICAVSPNDFPPNRDGSDICVRLSGPQMKGDFVVMCRPHPGFQDGGISLNEFQRSWCMIAITDQFQGELYDPFSGGPQAYLGSIHIEVGFASTKSVTDKQFDQDELSSNVIRAFSNQVFAPGQKLLMDHKGLPLSLTVRTIQLVDLGMQNLDETAVSSNPRERGILTSQTSIAFFKDANSPIKIKAWSKRGAANSIVAPDFKFEDMGIGGLDKEFQTIFRRAFASRVFPPGLIERLGIRHVKGILLFGPPGTGKTLIARQIGKMLNAKEPKVVNGPEILNKYVGQSEENIRKLFADAEKEYKEKGDESDLHIIIFDEFDAVCKRRGSSGSSTGVGDSVVNQLLSKIDGVDQLNNVLIIGMTNRKDLIDEALLRPGRLEIQVEISLPDEHGRLQILNIHTAKMRGANLMANDVNLQELAARTKNFSGAELTAVVNAATSYAFTRHIKGGSMAAVMENADRELVVNKEDFVNALDDVQPAYGVSNEGLAQSIEYGIIPYSDAVRYVVEDCLGDTQSVKEEDIRQWTVLLHGPKGAGKTALAAEIARRADYPFVKMITPDFLVGFRDDLGKKDRIHEVFTDAYKSRLSLLVLDDLENLIEWSPVGPRFSNTIQQTLTTLIRAPPPKDHKLLILVTTSQPGVLDLLGMADLFDKRVPVPLVRDLKALGTVLTSCGAFESSDGVEQALRYVHDGVGGHGVGIGIKTILKTVKLKRGPKAEQPQQFADALIDIIRLSDASRKPAEDNSREALPQGQEPLYLPEGKQPRYLTEGRG